MKKMLSILLAFTMVLSLSVPAFAATTPAETAPTQERITAEKLFDNIEPSDVVTTYDGDRITTVTTYILDNGEIVTDTFERGANIARSLEGSDTATRTVNAQYGTIKLTASFKWWTSSGTPGNVGSWQSVECTYANATFTPAQYCSANQKSCTHSDGAIAWGTAWAQASAFFYPTEYGTLIGNTYSVKITCDDEGKISDSVYP